MNSSSAGPCLTVLLLVLVDDLDDLVVQDEDEGTAEGADDVGEVALEEGGGALIAEDLLPAVHRALKGERQTSISLNRVISPCHCS